MRKTDLPETLNISGKRCTVEYCKKLPTCGKTRKACWATHNSITNNIQVFNPRGSSPGYCFEVLLHESLHSIDESYVVGISESQIQILAPAIHALLKDNPKLLKLL